MKIRSGVATYVVGTLLCLVGLGVAPLGIRDRELPARAAGAPARPAPAGEHVVPVAELVALAPFRSTRRAPEVTYAEARARGEASRPDEQEGSVVRPDWQLTGIVWGDTPIALFDGIEGEGRTRLAAIGDDIGPFRVARIDSTEVVVSRGDSTWIYRITVPWT